MRKICFLYLSELKFCKIVKLMKHVAQPSMQLEVKGHVHISQVYLVRQDQ